jgi:hypothetical protein
VSLRPSPGVVARAQRTISAGRCLDCQGKGERQGRMGKTVQCPTCSGSGKLQDWTVAQVSYAAALTVAVALDALAELLRSGAIEQTIDRNGGPDLWRMTPPKA